MRLIPHVNGIKINPHTTVTTPAASLTIPRIVSNLCWTRAARLRVAPVLDMNGNAGFLDRQKVFGVSGHKWQTKPDGDSGNQTIRKFDNRALLAGCGLDGGSLQIVGGDRRNLFVLVQPKQGFL